MAYTRKIKECIILMLVIAGQVFGQVRLFTSQLDSTNDLFDVGGGTPFGTIYNPTHVTANMWDNNVDTKASWSAFLGGGDGEQALVGIYGMPKRYVPTRFTLTMPGDAPYRNWTNFVFEGSNDSSTGINGTWQTIGVFDCSNIKNEWQTFRPFSWISNTYNPDFVATNGYNSFRMRVTGPLSSVTNAVPHLSEIEIFGYEYIPSTAATIKIVLDNNSVGLVNGSFASLQGDCATCGNLIDNSNWWTPAEISPVGWWDATIISNNTIISDINVSALADRSGNGHHLTQVFAGREPSIWRRNINYLNANQFETAYYDMMEVANFPVPADGNFMVFQVSDVDNLNNAAGAVFSMDNSVPTDWQYSSGTSASDFIGRIVSSGLGASTVDLSATPRNGPAIYNLVFDFTGGTISAYHDGSFQTNTTYTTKVGSTQLFRIMANRNGFNNVGGGVAETLIVSNVTTEVRQKIEGYLAWKYSFTLPAGHPYKNERPLK